MPLSFLNAKTHFAAPQACNAAMAMPNADTFLLNIKLLGINLSVGIL